MRAVVLTGFGGIDRLEFRRDHPLPAVGKGDVLVRVGACGINNTDINLRTRWYDRAGGEALSEEVGLRGVDLDGTDAEAAGSWKSEAVPFPRIQGAAVVGRIAAVGAGVDAARIGQRVILDPQVRDLSLPPRAQLQAYLGGERDGGFAEFVAIPAENACAVDSSLSDAELATFPTSYDTAEEMLVRARLSAGETVVITGAAGGVGTALIQLAKVRGARVIAIAGSGKEDRLRALGADAVVARDSADVLGTVRAITGPRGADVVADVVGGEMFGALLKMLSRGGRYSTAGAIAGPLQQIDLRDLIYKDLEMYGITCPAPETFRRIVHLAETGQIRPLVEKTYPLEALPEAQAEFVRRRHVGKLVIVI
ncbi:MAG: alcohol dehydrogenase family protein [Rubellimicrobium sp.]|nr:alcohol dehydrogenase family protein [Rubellimicrobium sp.]